MSAGERARALHKLAARLDAVSRLHRLSLYTRDPAFSRCTCGYEADGYDAQAAHECSALERVLTASGDPRFDVWYALWQIEQESESWLRTRDDCDAHLLMKLYDTAIAPPLPTVGAPEQRKEMRSE